MTIVTATDIQNNFGKYLQLVQTGEEIVILRNGVEMARRSEEHTSELQSRE